ncbi:MAG: hypothetical protein B6U78_02180 [Candidatus Aenigmarchaeota archaeon ex4484_224]|nr:MAG: hypothetical protein B6U78_02180 [Candidatus Aenigmarchaeota archaeon ex4484_224]
MKQKIKILLPLVEGFNELELINILVVLKKAGIEVDVVGLPNKIVKGENGITLMLDRSIFLRTKQDFEKVIKGEIPGINLNEYYGIILIGGEKGYKILEKSEAIKEIVKRFFNQGKLVAASSLALFSLKKFGILENRKVSAPYGFEREFEYPRREDVVVDGNLITSRGIGKSLNFAVKIVESILGKSVANKIKEELLIS